MYTKGEWQVVSDPLGKFTDIFVETGMPIATIRHYTDREQDLANAHLIASAPELYEALSYIIRALDEAGYIKANSIFMDMPNKALAKAEGG